MVSSVPHRVIDPILPLTNARFETDDLGVRAPVMSNEDAIARSHLRPAESGSCLTSLISGAESAARVSMPASPYKPAVKDPVVSFSHPIMYGPKKPPRLPTEFTNAIPAAAAAP
jgi:hypothetical protein